MLGTTALVAASLATGGAAPAQTIWTGSTSNDYNTATNWNPANVPDTNTEIAQFTTGGANPNINLSAPVTIQRWLLDGTTSYTLGGSAVTLDGGFFALISNSSSVAQRIDNVIAGAGGLNHNGPGTLTIGGINTFTGGTFVGQGTLTVLAGATLGDTANSVTASSSGTLDLSGTTQTLNGGVQTNGGTITNGTLVSSGTFNFRGGTVAAVLSGTGVLSTSGGSTSQVTFLNGANTYSGGTILHQGAIAVGADTNLGAATGALTFNGGMLRFNASFDLAATRNITLNAGFGNNTFDTNGFNTTVSQTMTGTGALTKTGAGTLTLANTNTYTGGTTINGGTLAVSADNNLGGAAGALSFNGGTLQTLASFASARGTTLNGGGTFSTDAGTTLTMNGPIGGGGALTKAGDGTLALTGANTYTGATNVNDGILLVTGSLASPNIAVNGAGHLQYGGTASAGSANITNNNFLSFSQSATAGSATITSNGFLNFNDTSNAGSAAISNNFVTNFNQSSSAGSATIIGGGDLSFNDTSSAGSATISNDGGLLAFNGSSTAANATIVNNFGMQFTDTSTAGSANITNNLNLFFMNGSTAGNAVIVNNGTLQFINTSTGGSATITNNNNMFFAGTNTAGSATITNNGALQFTAGSTAGNATILNNSLLTFASNGTGGNAQFITNAGGLTLFSGSIGPLSDGRLTAGSIAGAGNYVLPFNELTVGSNNLSTAVGGGIAGTGGLTKVGLGTLTLSGNNTYFGATNVNAGALLVHGSIANSSGATVNSGGTLGGTGTLPNTAVNSGGAFAPGASVGTITVIGNLTFNAGSLYQVEVAGALADRTNVTGVPGTATINGGTVQVLAVGGSFRPQIYTIVNAVGPRTGTFAGLTVGGSFGPSVNNPRLSYDATNVYLSLDASSITPVVPPDAGDNSKKVGESIDAAVAAGATPPLAFDNLFNIPISRLGNALGELSGEVATGMQQAGLRSLDLFLGVMLNPFLHGRGEVGSGSGPALAFAPEHSPLPADAAQAYAAALKAPAKENFERRWSVWGSAFGGTSNIDGNTTVGSANTRTNAYGFALGADHRLSPNTLVGFALAGGGTHWSLASSLGTGRSDMFQAGVYGSHRFGAAYVSAAAAYTRHEASTSRTITLAGSGQLTSDFSADSFGGRIEGGYRWLTPLAGVTPYGAAQVLSIRTPNYNETGTGGAAPFALAYASRTTTATRTELGLWFDRSSMLSHDSALTLRSRLAWAHDFNTDRAINPTFQALPLASFTVLGASPAPDFALVSAAAEWRHRNGWSFGLKGDAEVASRTQTYSGTGIARYVW